MIAFIDLDLAPIIACAAGLALAVVFFASISTARRKRIQQLVTANELLEGHQVCLRKLLEDERVSDKIKGQLLAFSDVLADRREFLQVVEEVAAEANIRADRRDESAFERDMTELEAVEEGLGRHLGTVVSTGVAAMLLLYGQVNASAMAKLYADRRADRSLFASASKHDRASVREISQLPTGLIGATP